jgi:transposase
MNSLTVPLEEHLILKNEVESLKAQVEWFKRQLFGKKSEKIIQDSPDQLLLFEPLASPELEVVKINSHDRVKSNKTKQSISFPPDLPVERTVYDLEETQKICQETGKSLVKIGEEISQKLACKPGSYYIKEIVRIKYAAPKGAEETIRTAFMPDSILPRCKADESLLADILTKKFSDHLPLYRQSEILARDKIQISRQVLSRWVIKCGIALKPLYEQMKKEIIESRQVFIDEVPISMLKPGNGQVHQAYMWVMVGGKEANPYLRVYNFKENRKHEHAAELLSSFKDGVVHSDKYGAYEVLANKKKFVWCPCWVHIRRKFFEAEGGDSNFIQLVLRKIRYLFMFERVAWSRSEDERIRIRREKELPIIDELIELIKSRLVNGSALPKSKFKEALVYFLGLVPYLKNYTDYPFARMDNNVAERAVRPLAVGRKNWLFLGSEDSGESSATVLSLVQTCKALGINPREYLEDVMRRLTSYNFGQIDQLLPHKWKKQS